MLLPSSLFAQQPVGYVLEVEGAWTVSGQPIKAGQALAGGSLVTNPQANDFDRIVITNPDGALLLLAECRNKQCSPCVKSGDCKGMLVPLPSTPAPSSRTSESTTSMVFRVVSDMIWSKPEKYVFARVRGESLNDAVLHLNSGRIDLAPALSDIERGMYGVRFRTLPVEKRPSAEWVSETVSLNWDPAKPADVLVPGLRPGLYQIVLTRPGSPGDAGAMSAWVLVADADFSKLGADFKSATSTASSWSDSVAPETTKAYLRASLEYLASQVQSGNPR
jgi:hypothetical protein